MVRVQLRSDASAVREARDALEAIRSRVPASVFDDVRLLISELVTNSVRHARVGVDDDIDVSVEVVDGVIRAEISDRGPGFTAPTPRAPATVEASGWGLYLVERITDRWGTRSSDGRSCVWFELDLSSS